MLQNEKYGMWYRAVWLKFCTVSEKPAAFVFRFKESHVLQHISKLPSTSFYLNVFVSMLTHLIYTQKNVLHCFKLLSFHVIFHSEHMFLSIILHASTIHCRSTHVLVPAAINWWHQHLTNNITITAHVPSSFLFSKVCTYKWPSSELLFHTICNCINAHVKKLFHKKIPW
jgi:hypothetical protein